MQKYQLDKSALLQFWYEHGVASERVLRAFESIPREEFVPTDLRSHAYEDTPLPLLRGKTISQPSTVILMTQALEIEPGNKILEIGTGSGYQLALLARLVGPRGRVVSCEIIPELVAFAKSNLNRLGIKNVKILEMDGSQGVPDCAPFDRIILTAAAPQFPQPLVDQLVEDGVILGPVGDMSEQEMVKGIKENGKLRFNFLGQFLFTPMLGKNGFSEDSD